MTALISSTASRDLLEDPTRSDLPGTGIYVRAVNAAGRWDNVDIAHLDTASLDQWLRSRNSIEWPIGVVNVLLGH